MRTDAHGYTELADRLGRSLSADQMAMIGRYHRFLTTDAVAAGGIGPAEVERIDDRHIKDSMLFLAGIPASATSLVDIGSGVGLPGIPIAICAPGMTVTLVDRSQRRTDLAGRAVRMLGLSNVTVLTGDADHLIETCEMATFRASFPVERAAAFVGARAPCVGLVGVSRLERRPDLPDPPENVTFGLTEESQGMLDSPFWLLRMTSA